MNPKLERSPKATVGTAPCPEVQRLPIEPIQGWFRRLNNGQGLRPRGMASTCLEQRLCGVGDEFTHGGAGLRILVMGQPKALKPVIQEQIYMILREALLNALRHSEPTSTHAKVEYQRRHFRVLGRHNAP